MKYLIIITAFLILLSTGILGAYEEKPVFYFFYSTSCPHCHEAYPYIQKLKNRYPQIEFREMEVRNSMLNRLKFQKIMRELNLKRAGVPLFTFEGEHIIGYKKGEYEKKIIAMIKSGLKKIAAREKKKDVNCRKSLLPDLRRDMNRIETAFSGCVSDGKQAGYCFAQRLTAYKKLYRTASATLMNKLSLKARSNKTAATSLTLEKQAKKSWEKYFSLQAQTVYTLCTARKKDAGCDTVKDDFKTRLLTTRINRILERITAVCR